jgi:hypothetical protein
VAFRLYVLCHSVGLPESALFSSFGIICLEPLPSTLPDEFSMENMNISGFFQDKKYVALATGAITRLTHHWSQ